MSEQQPMSKAAALLQQRQTKDHYTFEQWLGFLDVHYFTIGATSRISVDTGAETWRDYYDDGFTARDAMMEDLSYGCC